MKKILILLASIYCCGCSDTPQKEMTADTFYDISAGVSVRYIEFDGHQFIEYRLGGVHGGGSLCHSPNCPCLDQYKTQR